MAALPYLLAAVVLASTSQLLLRRGMASLGSGVGLAATFVHALRSPAAWGGSIGYATAMGCWLQVLARSEIGLVYPVFTGGVTCLVMVASVLVLRERLDMRNVAGALLMVAGIFVAYLEG